MVTLKMLTGISSSAFIAKIMQNLFFHFFVESLVLKGS